MKLQRYIPIIEMISNRAEITMAKSDDATWVKANEAEARIKELEENQCKPLNPKYHCAKQKQYIKELEETLSEELARNYKLRERIKALEEEIKSSYKLRATLTEELNGKDKQIQELEEILKQYADEKNYTEILTDHFGKTYQVRFGPELAQQALKDKGVQK